MGLIQSEALRRGRPSAGILPRRCQRPSRDQNVVSNDPAGAPHGARSPYDAISDAGHLAAHNLNPQRHEAATGFPATASSMNDQSALDERDKNPCNHRSRAHDRNVAANGANLIAADLVLELKRRRLHARLNLELHASSSSNSHRLGTRSCFSMSQFLSVSIRESARPIPMATIVNITVKRAARASSIC